MPRDYFLLPTAIRHLRHHKKWSLDHFSANTTKKYFQDIQKGFQYIADHHERFPKRSELTRESGFFLYPVREHYVVYIPSPKGIHIIAVLGQTQDIPNILQENASAFQREMAQYEPSPTKRSKRKSK